MKTIKKSQSYNNMSLNNNYTPVLQLFDFTKKKKNFYTISRKKI